MLSVVLILEPNYFAIGDIAEWLSSLLHTVRALSRFDWKTPPPERGSSWILVVYNLFRSRAAYFHLLHAKLHQLCRAAAGNRR